MRKKDVLALLLLFASFGGLISINFSNRAEKKAEAIVTDLNGEIKEFGEQYLIVLQTEVFDKATLDANFGAQYSFFRSSAGKIYYVAVVVKPIRADMVYRLAVVKTEEFGDIPAFVLSDRRVGEKVEIHLEGVLQDGKLIRSFAYEKVHGSPLD